VHATLLGVNHTTEKDDDMPSPEPNAVTQIDHRYSDGDSDVPIGVVIEVKPEDSTVDITYIQPKGDQDDEND
jgi:hypothetical protein